MSLALVNPPFDIRCKIFTNAYSLTKKTFYEIIRVIKSSGTIYYVIPTSWLERFMKEILEKNKHYLEYCVISKNISMNKETKLPISLIRIVKN